MLPGEFVGIVVDFENTHELIEKVGEGYLKASWNDENGLKTGYLIVSSGNIVGMIVEDLMTRKTTKGKDALDEIIKVCRERKVKAVELYKASVEDILKEFPDAKVSLSTLPGMIPGHELEELIDLLTSYEGELKVHHPSTSWSIHVEGGKVKAAKTIRGPTLRGDPAVRHLFREMGEVLRNGQYEMGRNMAFSPFDIVEDEHDFIGALELLNEKRKIDLQKNS